MITLSGVVQLLDRQGVQPWLPQLDAWLLPGAFFGVQQTWPQLYRRDGDGLFFTVFDGDRLLSHCACRLVTVHGENGAWRACLLGSVATDPEFRGQGLATQVLSTAIDTVERDRDLIMLWAEQPTLYARAGFVDGPEEAALVLVRRPRTTLGGVRLAHVSDHPTLHELHRQKPWRVERNLHDMSGLLTTPGMTVVVLEREGRVVAYACTGKGADLQGHWHEVGGADEDVALLLPAAMHLTDQIDSVLLLPPYRPQLRQLLAASVVDELRLPGPMLRTRDGSVPRCWIDGLDSV